jgi:hypothetical protein
MVQWNWNTTEKVACGPDISCYGVGNEYAHGGVSVQECLIPDLVFEMEGGAPDVTVTISEIKWRGLRCSVTVAPATKGLNVDMRTKINEPQTSMADTKVTDEKGVASLLVTEDKNQGTAAHVVISVADGRIIAKQPTTVGGD